MLITVLLACSSAPRGFELELPIACEVGRTCWVQNYFDHDPGAGATDFRCNPRTYDGHDGVDIRLRNVAAMDAGVNVLAAAAGKVRGARDGEPERMLKDGESAPSGRECGNGVVIEHGGGWETQYCHMAAGSVQVHPGDEVAAGGILGRVGLSGKTQFPHAHLTVRKDGVAVDPFAADLPTGTCTGGTSLWSPAAAAALAYHPSDVVDVGFAGGPVSLEEAETGVPAPTPTSDAMIGWARAIGLRKGDVQSIRLVGPDGEVVSDQTGPPLPRPKATWVQFSGKRNTTGQLPAGTWTMQYTVVRDGEVVLDQGASIDL